MGFYIGSKIVDGRPCGLCPGPNVSSIGRVDVVAANQSTGEKHNFMFDGKYNRVRLPTPTLYQAERLGEIS